MSFPSPSPLLVRTWSRKLGRTCHAIATLGLVTSLTSSILSSCEDEKYTALCAVIVDGSSSGSLFNAEKSLDAGVVKFLTDQRCGRVAFVPLNGRGEGSTCSEPILDLDPGVGDPEIEIPPNRDKALEIAHRQLKCAAKEYDGSDVLGAFRRAARLRPQGQDAYSWLVVSDMIHTEKGVDLSKADLRTPESRRSLITSMQPRIPNMTGCHLFVTDMGEGISDSTFSTNFANFWDELFASPAAGSPTMKRGYGA
jgi:hypothetical protein